MIYVYIYIYLFIYYNYYKIHKRILDAAFIYFFKDKFLQVCHSIKNQNLYRNIEIYL
jgi:hypothetical protein